MLAIANTLGCAVDELVREAPSSAPKLENTNDTEQHPWVISLVLETINFVESYLTSRNYTPTFEQAMFFVREIYSFSLGTDDKKVDKRFGEWLINKSIPKE